MAQRSILITGCSSGIGFTAASELREEGWRVFAACRKQSDCEQLSKLGFETVLIDYADQATITDGLAKVLQATDGTLDALFNNGAYAIPGAVEDLPTDALRAIFEANFFGWHSLTRAVIPVMRAQGHGRIIQCSSVLGFVGMPWRGAYNATKHALEGLTDTMRIEMRDTPIHISTIEPGPITTRFRDNAALQFENWIDWRASARVDQYKASLMPRLYEEKTPDRFELPTDAVVKKLTHALTAKRPKPRYYVTIPTHIAGALRRLLPTRALDWILSR